MRLLCHSSGTRRRRRFCFANFKQRSHKNNVKDAAPKHSASSSSSHPKNKEEKKRKGNSTRQTPITSFARNGPRMCFTRYERMSSSSSSGLSTDSFSSDSDDSDAFSLHGESGLNIPGLSNTNDDFPVVVTSTDESDSDFSESDISSVLSPWSTTDSSTSEDEVEREFEFYNEPDANRQTLENRNIPSFSDLIDSIDSQIAQLLPLSIQVISESLLRNFSDDVGWGPCPSCIVDILLRRRIDQDDIDTGSSCCICCADFKLDEEVINLPCKHFYHTECISNWLKIRSTCPTCRFDVCSLSDLPETEV